jgi:hypothetical protein
MCVLCTAMDTSNATSVLDTAGKAQAIQKGLTDVSVHALLLTWVLVCGVTETRNTRLSIDPRKLGQQQLQGL